MASFNFNNKLTSQCFARLNIKSEFYTYVTELLPKRSTAVSGQRSVCVTEETGRYAHSAPIIKATLSSEHQAIDLVFYEVAARAVNQFELKFSQVP